MTIEPSDKNTIVIQSAVPNWYVARHLPTPSRARDEANIPTHYPRRICRQLKLRDLGLYMNSQKRSGYRVIRWKEAAGGQPSVLINWDNDDPALRELLRDVRFRKALSLAVDREKCNQVVWRGLGVAQQAT